MAAEISMATDGLEDIRGRAAAGDVAAMRQLADALYRGQHGAVQDKAAAFRWYHKLHDAGEAYGTYMLGICHKYGTGCARDIDVALAWLKAAAERKSGAACLALYLHFSKEGPGADPAQAAVYVEKGAALDNPGCCFHLGMHYIMGRHGKPRELDGVPLLEAAAQQGLGGALYQLGLLCLRGDLMPRNPRRAFRLFEAAWDCADSDASVCFGDLPLYYALCLMTGTGCDIDKAAARAVLEKSAAAGNAVIGEVLKTGRVENTVAIADFSLPSPTGSGADIRPLL